MSLRTLAIIQARMGSTRLPGKVLSEIKGKPLILHMIERLRRCKKIDHLVLATSTSPRDKILIETAKQNGVDVFAGSEADVLDRFYQAARLHSPEQVVRLTGDCPLIDPVVTDLVIDHHLKKRADYTSNVVTRCYPRGLDTEVMTFKALEKAAKEAARPHEREHVTPYFYEHPKLFSIEQVVAGPAEFMPDLRLTVDTPEDLALVTQIFLSLYDKKPDFSLDDILQLIKDKPQLKNLNAHVQQKAAF